MLELVETQEEAYVKNDVQVTKEAYLEKQIDTLEKINRSQELQIRFLEGQISVYERYMFN